MGQYTSYYLYQKFEKRDGQDFIPVYPNTYSVDADGTMPKVIKEQNDVNCGYVPPSDQIYQWVQLTPSSDPDSYWCDNCPAEPIYRWTVMTPTSDPSTYWCEDCNEIYRWVDSGTTCVGYDLYQRAIRQVSFDSGATWENVVPAEYSATTLIEEYSENCGFVPKLIANYSGGTTYRLVCDTSTTLSQTEVRGHSTSYTAMTSAEIGNNCVTSIGSDAFNWCTNLTSITIPNSVTSIGDSAFRYCTRLPSITINNTVTSIGNYAFYSCERLTSIDIPYSVTNIGDNAFSSCGGLSSMTVNSNNATYDSRNNCNAIIKTSTNTLLFGCKNTVIPNTVTSIGVGAFYYATGLTSIDIPDSVTSISGAAFQYCYYLTSIMIPNSVTSIGNFAFYYCSRLASITVNATTPPTLGGSNVFTETNNCPILVPSQSLETYKSAWSSYASRIQVIQT